MINMVDYKYKYEVGLNTSEGVKELFSIIEKLGDGEHGLIKPLDDKSLEISTKVLGIEEE